MSTHSSAPTGRAAELRLAFDRSFAESVHVDATIRDDLLAIRVGGQPCALRLTDIAGLYADKKITPVAGSATTLRGIAGFRGAIMPVYDLPLVLGHEGSPSRRWLVVAAAAPIALAFETFECQLRISRAEIFPQTLQGKTTGYAREFVRTQNFTGPIMHLPSILDAINASGLGLAPKEE